MVAKDKTQILLTLPKDVKEKLSAIAESQNRTLTNMINTILLEYLKEISSKIE